MQTGYLKDVENKPIYPITSSSCVMTKDGTLDEKLDGLEEKVDNALPKSEKDNLFGMHNKNNLPICTFGNLLNFQHNDSLVARVGGHGDSLYHNVWIDAVNDGTTATRFQVRKKISDGSVEAFIVNLSNGTWGTSSKIYGDHNLDYVKQKLGGGNCNIKTGTYTGDGANADGKTRTINIGVTPKIVFVTATKDTTVNQLFIKFGKANIAFYSQNLQTSYERSNGSANYGVTTNGFNVNGSNYAYQAGFNDNVKDMVYNYIAIY